VHRTKGLVVTLKAGRACTVVLGASVKAAKSKRSSSTKVVRGLKTKRQTLRLASGKARTVKLRFSKRGLDLITRAIKSKRAMTLTLAVIERDATKRVSKRTLRSKLRP
jgi:hypothetical protein